MSKDTLVNNSKVTARPPVITVDGPVGSGKGSLSVMLARKLGFNLLDSGALYRVLSLAVHNQQIAITDEQAIHKLALGLNIRFIETHVGEPAAILLDNQDVSAEIRKEYCGELASKISAYQVVRDALLELQKSFMKPPGLVADGRDMGTIVFPDADIKFFLTASQEERAQRRFAQIYAKNSHKDLNVTYESLLQDIKKRDDRDINRSIAPLKPASDAVIIDSSEMTIKQVFNKMLETISNTLPL